MFYYARSNSIIAALVRMVKKVFEVYPADKYARIRKRLEAEGFDVINTVSPLSNKDVRLAHSAKMTSEMNKLLLKTEGTSLEESELLFSSKMLTWHFRSVANATYYACKKALQVGVGANLGGGFHHARRNKAGAFCLINDVAVGIKKLQQQKDFSS